MEENKVDFDAITKEQLLSVGIGVALNDKGFKIAFFRGNIRVKCYYKDWQLIQKHCIHIALSVLHSTKKEFNNRQINCFLDQVKDKDKDKMNEWLDKITYHIWMNGYESGERKQLGKMLKTGDISFDYSIQDIHVGVLEASDIFTQEPYWSELLELIKLDKHRFINN